MYHGKGTGNYQVLAALLEVGLLSMARIEMASIIRQSDVPVRTGQQSRHLRRPQIRLRIPLSTRALLTPTLRRDPAQTRTLQLVHPLLMISPLPLPLPPPLPVLHPRLHPQGRHLIQRT